MTNEEFRTNIGKTILVRVRSSSVEPVVEEMQIIDVSPRGFVKTCDQDDMIEWYDPGRFNRLYELLEVL